MEAEVNAVLEKVAAQNDVTVAEEREETQKAINEAMQSEEPLAKMYWKILTPDGVMPTPEMLIPLLAAICSR